MNTERFAENNFTALRLSLALLVVLGHFRILAGIGSPPWPFDYAAAAVECFFVVSGYLVSNSFDRDPDLRRFYVKRFFRLYPLYITVVFLQTMVLAFLASGGIAANITSLARYFLANAIFANFLQYDLGSGALRALSVPGLNPSLWTLKIEASFYLLLPALWWLVRRFGLTAIAIIFVLSASFYESFKAAGHYDIAKQLPGQLQFFVLGIAAYRYRNHFVFGIMGLPLAIASGSVLTALLQAHPPGLYPLVVGAFVALTALATPPLKVTRDISYGVYLFHGPLIQLALLMGFYRPDLLGLAAILGLVLLLALAAERLVEAPGIAFGRRLLRRLDKRTRFTKPVPAREVAANEPELHVLVLNDFCYVQGGASKVAIEEAVSLARTGAKVTFLGAVGPPCDALRNAGIVIECLDQRELLEAGRHPTVLLQALWNVKARRRTREILSVLPRENTIVHLHGYTKALTTSPIGAARRLGFPVVCTLHDFFAACPNGAFFDYVKQQPCTKCALTLDCIATRCDKRHYLHKLYRVVRGLLQRSVLRFPHIVRNYVALSERSQSLLTGYLPSQARIYPLANMMEVARGPCVEAARKREIVYVGRLDAEKGVLLLADVAVGLGLSLTFIGDGPLRDDIAQRPGMTVTGWLDKEAVQRRLGSVRCLVFPSLWYETYGLVVDEAAARGIPVIVSDISAAAERVRDGVTGWLFRSGDPEDLARCLMLVANDEHIRAASQAAYRAFWTNASTSDLHARSLREIYHSVLQN